MRTASTISAAALVLCTICGPAFAAADCQLLRVTTLDMAIDSFGGVYVPMSVGGQPVNLLIDTGGIFSMLTQSSVDAIGLKPVLIPDSSIMMFGGKHIDHYVTAHDIDFGGLQAKQHDFLIMPDGFMSRDLGGTLAPDVLRAYDDDFDFANAKFNLFSPDHCEGQVVYWTRDFSVVDFNTDPSGHIHLPVTLDGKEVRAGLDTGSSRSVMTLEWAEEMFGFDEKSADLKDLGGHSLGHAYKYPFKTLTFGGVTVSNPDILLVPDTDAHMRIALLGMGILRQLHMYIAYKEHKLYVSSASAHL